MKKQRFFMLGIITVLVAVLSLTFVSSTFAKYTSSVTGSDFARVAKWEWKSGSEVLNDTITFDLFNTIKDENGSAEADVFNKLGDPKTVIAPGTSGSFELKFTNNSEVNAKYKIDYTVVKNGIPVQFSVDGGATWTDDLADVAFKNVTQGTEETVKVEWKWAFDSASDDYPAGWNDKSDTDLGKAGSAEITVTATVTFEQIN